MTEPKNMFDYITDDEDLGCEREEQFITHFIQKNEFPDYKTCQNLLLKDKQIGVEMWSEFGEINHRLLKEAYENFKDETKLKNIGSIINRMGGMTALQMNCYALNRICNYLLQTSETKYSHYENVLISYINKHYLSVAWDGVGDWKH